MTTITYREGIMAADSQVTLGGYKWSQARKIVKLDNGALVGVCGSLVNGAKFVRRLIANDGVLNEDMIKDSVGMGALYVNPNGEVWIIEGGKRGGYAAVEGPFFADGSGFAVAMAAMKGGADAFRAVEIAAELDPNTALPVVWEQLGEPPVKKKRRKRK